MRNKKHYGFELGLIANAIKRTINSEIEHTLGDGITAHRGRVIGYLYDNREKDIFQRDLENKFEVSRPTMTAILQSMEKNGLITRTSVETDARLKKITLTEKGIGVNSAIRDAIDKTEAAISEGISEQDTETFMSVARQIQKNLVKINERNVK